MTEGGKDNGITIVNGQENVGLQERPTQFGVGETKRAYELGYKGFSFGFNLGDVAQVPTEAVMCPTTPWLEIGGGGIENRLADEIGETLFEKYAQKLMKIVERIHETKGFEQATAARELADLLEQESGIKVPIPPEKLASDILAASKIDHPGGKKHGALHYGAAIPAPSGKLLEKGIKSIILVNVTPDGSMPGQDKGMTRDHMVMFTQNACNAANNTGAKSITIPGVGTGFAAALGFGMSREDSIAGFFMGAKKFADELGGKANLRQIDYNIYAQATEENAQEVAQLMSKFKVKPLLQSGQ